MPKIRTWKISDEVRDVVDNVESQVAQSLDRYSKSELRRMQKKLKQEIFERSLEELNSRYLKGSVE